MSNKYLGRYIPVTNIKVGEPVKIISLPENYDGELVVGDMYEVACIDKCKGDSDCMTTCTTNNICIWIKSNKNNSIHICRDIVLGNAEGYVYKGMMYPWQT